MHDGIRRVKGGFDRIAKGVMALHAQLPRPRLIARSVVQRDNAHAVEQTITAASRMGFDEISFLAADVSSTAFNRQSPWPAARTEEVALGRDELAMLEGAIDRVAIGHHELIDSGFVAGGRASLDRIAQYYRALAGEAEFPEVACNAPWVSAVLEPGDALRPCFFQSQYEPAQGNFAGARNADRAVEFRRHLDVANDQTCRRCVCSLSLPLTSRV